MSDPGALLETAVLAARAGGDVVRDAARERSFTVSLKSSADYVTEVDLASERAIRDVVARRHPDHGFLGEEGGLAAEGSAAPWRWVVDPLDGTTNFIHGIPWYAVAVAVEHDGAPVASAVLDAERGHLFAASSGGGATCDGAPIRVSAAHALGEGLVATGIPFRALHLLPRYMPELDRVARRSSGIRRLGSAALDLAYVACGRLLGFWEHGLGRWDVSAGGLLVAEAGGRVSDHGGGTGWLDTGQVVASNGRVHEALMACLSPAPSEVA